MRKKKKVPIGAIKIGDRYRKDLGDIESLARSIDEIGLLHPVIIDESDSLIAGLRRLKACQKLGWDSIPVHRIGIVDILRGQYDENVLRKDYTPSEKVAIIDEMKRRLEEEKTEKHKGGRGKTVSESERVRPSEEVPMAFGWHHDTYYKAKEICEKAEENPERFGDFKDRMDETNVNSAYRTMQKEINPPEIIEYEYTGEDWLCKCGAKMKLMHGRYDKHKLELYEEGKSEEEK